MFKEMFLECKEVKGYFTFKHVWGHLPNCLLTRVLTKS